MIEETATFNISGERLKTMGCGRRFLSDIVRWKNRFLSLLNLTKKANNEKRRMCVPCLPDRWLKSLLFSNSYIFVCEFIHHE